MTPLSLIAAGVPDETALALRAELINLIPEVMPKGSRSDYILRTPAGVTAFEQVAGSGDIRGIYAMGEILYIVAGERLYSVDDAGNRTNLGTILGSSRVYFADGYIPDTSRQLAIGTGDFGYIYDTVDGLTEITAADFVDRVVPTTPAYIGGYFVWPTEDGFLPSDLLEPLVYDAANFQSAESATDGVVALSEVYGQLWVFGGKTTEVFEIASSGETIFTRVQTIEYGLAAPAAIALADNGVFWLDQHKRFQRANGFTPNRASTNQVEQDLADRDVSDCFLFTWVWKGHEFIALTVPDGKTFVYDCQTQLWHRRKTEGTDRWFPNGVAVCYGQTFFADSEDGRICQMDSTVVREVGRRMIREFYTGWLHQSGGALTVKCLVLVVDTGNAFQTGTLAQTAPVIEQRYSDDGKSFCNFKARSLGLIGQYGKLIRWWRLGMIGHHGLSPQRIFHFRISDPVRADILAAGME